MFKDIFKNKIVRSASIIIVWIAGLISGLALLVIVLVNFPLIQNKLTGKIEERLSIITGTTIHLDRIHVYIPYRID